MGASRSETLSRIEEGRDSCIGGACRESAPNTRKPRPFSNQSLRIWRVEPDGGNLPALIAEAKRQVEREAPAWFESFRSVEHVLALLMADSDPPGCHSASDSAVRKHIIGYVARSLGKHEIGDPFIAESEAEMQAIRRHFDQFLQSKKQKSGLSPDAN